MTLIHTPRTREATSSPSRPVGSPPGKEAEPIEVLFPEAKRRERRRRLLALGALLGAAGLAGGLIASVGGSPPGRSGARARPGDGRSPVAVPGHLTYRGNGIGAARFGQAESVAIAELEKVLGAPTTRTPQSAAGNCTIDSSLHWSTMTAYFDHRRFVGYATGSLLGGPGHRKFPDATSGAGLRIGDTLAKAERLYGKALRVSYAQGGSWSATTSAGTLAGYLTADPGHPTPPVPRIADVTAGAVGCPAASP